MLNPDVPWRDLLSCFLSENMRSDSVKILWRMYVTGRTNVVVATLVKLFPKVCEVNQFLIPILYFLSDTP